MDSGWYGISPDSGLPFFNPQANRAPPGFTGTSYFPNAPAFRVRQTDTSSPSTTLPLHRVQEASAPHPTRANASQLAIVDDVQRNVTIGPLSATPSHHLHPAPAFVGGSTHTLVASASRSNDIEHSTDRRPPTPSFPTILLPQIPDLPHEDATSSDEILDKCASAAYPTPPADEEHHATATPSDVTPWVAHRPSQHCTAVIVSQGFGKHPADVDGDDDLEEPAKKKQKEIWLALIRAIEERAKGGAHPCQKCPKTMCLTSTPCQENCLMFQPLSAFRIR